MLSTALNAIERDPFSFIRGTASEPRTPPPEERGYRYASPRVSFSTARSPFQFFTLHCFCPPLAFQQARRHSVSLPSNHRLHLREEGKKKKRKKNQYNTKQWLIGLRVRCAERSLLYIMYGGQLMVSVLADKWTVSISPV